VRYFFLPFYIVYDMAGFSCPYIFYVNLLQNKKEEEKVVFFFKEIKPLTDN